MLEATEAQRKLAAELGVELPTNATIGQAKRLLQQKIVRLNKATIKKMQIIEGVVLLHQELLWQVCRINAEGKLSLKRVRPKRSRNTVVAAPTGERTIVRNASNLKDALVIDVRTIIPLDD